MPANHSERIHFSWGEHMKSTIQLTIAAVLLLGMSAYAHHSIVGTYDYNKHVTLDAKIVQVSLRNPHSFVQVEVPDASGVVQRCGVRLVFGVEVRLASYQQFGNLF